VENEEVMFSSFRGNWLAASAVIVHGLLSIGNIFRFSVAYH